MKKASGILGVALLLLVIWGCTSNSQTAAMAPVQTPTAFDRTAAVQTVQAMKTPTETATPQQWVVVPTLNPRMRTGSDCTGNDANGPYSYGIGEASMHPTSMDQTTGRFSNPSYEVCVQTDNGPKLKIVTSIVHPDCLPWYSPTWDEDLNGSCLVDSNGGRYDLKRVEVLEP